MSHLQSIERACHLANPKLLELSFGCRVKYYYSTETEGGTRVGIYVGPFDDGIKTFYNGNSEYVRQYEILGHPITLQDILLIFPPRFGIVASNGCILDFWKENEDSGIQYDLTKSPYDQSNEVLEFISKNI